jgi:septum formation protein
MLSDAGYVFIHMNPPFDDPAHPENHSSLLPVELAASLAEQKARSLLPEAPGHAVILAADTLCLTTDGRILGTPTSLEQARQMIRSFFNADHDIISAVALLPTPPMEGDPVILTDSATVHFGEISDEELEQYLATNHWQGKAGGYNLFDRQKHGWPVTVTGDPTTVVGLPLKKTQVALAQLGVHPTSTQPL